MSHGYDKTTFGLFFRLSGSDSLFLLISAIKCVLLNNLSQHNRTHLFTFSISKLLFHLLTIQATDNLEEAKWRRECDICGKTLSIDNLAVHKRTHLGGYICLQFFLFNILRIVSCERSCQASSCLRSVRQKIYHEQLSCRP